MKVFHHEPTRDTRSLVRDLTDNRVLRNSTELTRMVYELTASLPRSERFGMTSQIQRASVSIPVNIAEGLGRGSPGDLELFLRIASGSVAELFILLQLAADIHGVTSPGVLDKLDHIKRQLILLTRRVQASRAKPRGKGRAAGLAPPE